MDQPNVFTMQFVPDPDSIDGFHTSFHDLSVRPRDALVVNAREIAPGNHLCPYHYEFVEEWLVVMSGSVLVRTPDGTIELDAGAVMRFPAGPAGVHQISSPPQATVPSRVLMFSPDAEPAVTVYPESDKLAVYTRSGEDEVFVRRAAPSSHLDYFDGETP